MGRPETFARRVALASMAASALLAVVKIVVGLAASSIAVVSDGFESAADFFTSGLVLLGLWIAAKPPDEEHPYGHGRFEILTGLAIGVLLVAAGTGICVESIEQTDDHPPALYAAWPLLGSIVIKAALSVVKFRYGRRAGSTALVAHAWNDVIDNLSGVVALAAVLLSNFGSEKVAAADRYGGFAIGLIVVFLALRVVRETVMQLMDTMPDPTQMVQIRAAALRVPGVRGIEKCYARKTGLRYHVDLHLEVDPDLTVRESHEIARSVKNTIKADLDWVEDVLVHVEPYAAVPEPHG
ncbi:MAG: cation transporter [Acidobacteria bacterium]|jgi:cation diffusion facilitator family transporter|nr:MAG: cation transporter [Acidobacteriota bacterium]